MSSIVDPYGEHPSSEKVEKEKEKSLTFGQVNAIIVNKMIEFRTSSAPRWGYDTHQVIAILTGLLLEIKEECQKDC